MAKCIANLKRSQMPVKLGVIKPADWRQDTWTGNPLLSMWPLTLRVAPFWQSAGLVVFCTDSDFCVFRVFSRLSAVDCASYSTVLPFVKGCRRAITSYDREWEGQQNVFKCDYSGVKI
jgi:hypothetical protein